MADFKGNNLSSRIAIATSTLYNSDSSKDKLRADLAKKFIRESVDSDYELIIVDGGSKKEILSDFSRLGAKVYEQSEKGMGKGRREAMKYAYESGKDVLIWTEPEKFTFIKEISKVAEPILERRADLVVPKRKSLESYPILQQYSEPLGNLLFEKLTGVNLDIYFGPKVWSKDSVHYFLDYDGEYGDLWDSIQIPVMNAVFDKKRVLSIEVDYTHPLEQTKMEEDDLSFYRLRVEKHLINQLNSLESNWKKLNSYRGQKR